MRRGVSDLGDVAATLQADRTVTRRGTIGILCGKRDARRKDLDQTVEGLLSQADRVGGLTGPGPLAGSHIGRALGQRRQELGIVITIRPRATLEGEGNPGEKSVKAQPLVSDLDDQQAAKVLVVVW